MKNTHARSMRSNAKVEWAQPHDAEAGSSRQDRDEQARFDRHRTAQWRRALSAKLQAIRDHAMELEATLEFVHGGDARHDPIWQFADRTVRHAEEILSNSRGELEFPEGAR